MYNHKNQYRCTIIRGKAKKKMDDLLPAYANILEEICPCDVGSFETEFNNKFKDYLKVEQRTKKTFDNHRTEIAGTFFGMYYKAEDGYVYISDRTKKFIEDNDQPAFFKDICFKLQFPNGMTILKTLLDRVDNELNIRPVPYIIKTLMYCKNAGVKLSVNDVGYYILNSLDVLKGIANPLEVIDQMIDDKAKGIIRKVRTPGKASSYDMQHIRELVSYIELANLISIDHEHNIVLNENESTSLEVFGKYWNSALGFDVYNYDLSNRDEYKQFQYDWDIYYSQLCEEIDSFQTTITSLGITETVVPQSSGKNLVEIGDEGEMIVYNYEKERVMKFDKRLANKVLHLGKTKGLGYDIQSVNATIGDEAEFVKYIEVKTTKRVTEPDITNPLWSDTVNITRNEWIAAKQHKDLYTIFRVYLIRNNIIMYIIKDINSKHESGVIKVIPVTYRMDFNKESIDEVISQ